MKPISIIFILTVLLLAACAPAAVSSSAPDNYGGGAPAMEAPIAPEKAAYEVSVGVDTVQAQQRLVIQNADLVLVVTDPKAKMIAISQLAQELGGFVVASNLYETTTENGAQVPTGSLTIRVPAEQLESALAKIKDGVIDIQSENRTGQDVTQQYTDLKSQLKNLEATEQQLTLIMQKAEKTEDVLAVFNQLTQIRGQIEVTKGQIQYYEQSAALSAISVRLIAEESIQPIEIGGWKPVGVVRDAIQSLVNFLKGFFEFVVNLIIVIIPAIVLIFAVIYGMWRLFKFMFRLAGWKNPFKRKTPPAPPAAPVG
ncbi:MAG: DUF4349 domain-containing protein [Chloroflexi bacterium]|nr:MAG: DUF4349 domain-containing protein [Chloroflexota bacterium]